MMLFLVYSALNSIIKVEYTLRYIWINLTFIIVIFYLIIIFNLLNN